MPSTALVKLGLEQPYILQHGDDLAIVFIRVANWWGSWRTQCRAGAFLSHDAKRRFPMWGPDVLLEQRIEDAERHIADTERFIAKYRKE